MAGGKSIMKMRSTRYTLVLCTLLATTNPLFAQDLEPRRWTPLPPGLNVLAIGYGHTTGDLRFDPLLEVEDAEIKADTMVFSYVRSFSLAGKAVRFDALLPWQSARWKGLLRGEHTEIERRGLSDSRLRFSLTLLNTATGDPAEESSTVVGAAIAVRVPSGEYKKDKLLNLGQNRFRFRPQIGVLHTRGDWSFELTGSVFLYTDNDNFFNGKTREQDALYALQTHVVYVYKPGYWGSLSGGYGWGGVSSVDDVRKDDDWSNFITAFAVGFPVAQNQGVKLTYMHGHTQNTSGAVTDTLSVGWSVRF